MCWREQDRQTDHSCKVCWTVVHLAMPCAAWDKHCFSAGRLSSACCLLYCHTPASVPAQEMRPHPRHQPRNASERTHAQHAVCSCSAPWSPAAPAHWLPLPDDMLPLQSGSPTQHPPTQATLFASTQALHQLTVQPPYNNYATVHAWTHTYTHTCEHTSNRI